MRPPAALLAAFLILSPPLPALAQTPPERLTQYDECQAVGSILTKIAGADGTLAVRAEKQERIFRNLAFHTRRSDGASVVPAMTDTVRGRILAVKKFAELFAAAKGDVPEEFTAAANACGTIYAGIAKQPPPSPVYLWPKWEQADDPAYGTSCEDPVRAGGIDATGDVMKDGGGVSLTYYWLGTLRGADDAPVPYKRKGSGACPDAPDLGIVDAWVIGGKSYIVAPYAKGMPKLPEGYSAAY